MKLERVKHADVYPSDGNPRRDFGARSTPRTPESR